MQTTYLKSFRAGFAAILTLAFIFAFSNAKAGGEHFSIYLNKKLVETQVVHASKSDFINLQVNQLNAGDELSIVYDHCGKSGTSRTIVLKDEKNNVIKEWKFKDVADRQSGMTISANEILDLKKKHPGTAFNIYYTSKELPNGRKLAAINTGDKNSAFNNRRPAVTLAGLSACLPGLAIF